MKELSEVGTKVSLGHAREELEMNAGAVTLLLIGAFVEDCQHRQEKS